MFKSFWKGCQSLLEKSLGANTHFRSPKCDKNNFKNQKVPILIQPLFKKALHFFSQCTSAIINHSLSSTKKKRAPSLGQTAQACLHYFFIPLIFCLFGCLGFFSFMWSRCWFIACLFSSKTETKWTFPYGEHQPQSSCVCAVQMLEYKLLLLIQHAERVSQAVRVEA